MIPSLRTAIGDTAQTRALFDGRVSSALVQLKLTPFPTISRAFAPMVRELRFDVSELAIGTYLQARAAGVGLVLLPVVLAARYQEGALLCRADSPIRGPADLVGRRVGIRAYGQTTGLWLRGTLAEAHGVAADAVRWVTFEDAHVAGIADPAWAERAPAGSDMLEMLQAGSLDAAIFGAEVPEGAGLRTVFPDPAQAAAEFQSRHGLMPINHVLTARRGLAAGLMAEVVRMFAVAGADAPLLPGGRAAMEPAVRLAWRYAEAQGLLPGPLTEDDLWAGSPADLETIR